MGLIGQSTLDQNSDIEGSADLQPIVVVGA